MPNLDPVIDDLSAVQADDLLLNQLGSATPTAAGALVNDELNALLLAWRNEVETRTMPPLIDIDTAITAIASTARTWWATNTGLKISALALLLAVILTVALALTAADL